MAQDFHIKFVTTDGSIVMDRVGQVDYCYLSNGTPDKSFVDGLLRRDAREKGVRILSYQINSVTGVIATVAWL